MVRWHFCWHMIEWRNHCIFLKPLVRMLSRNPRKSKIYRESCHEIQENTRTSWKKQEVPRFPFNSSEIWNLWLKFSSQMIEWRRGVAVAVIAQSVERWTWNLKVAGPIPTIAKYFTFHLNSPKYSRKSLAIQFKKSVCLLIFVISAHINRGRKSWSVLRFFPNSAKFPFFTWFIYLLTCSYLLPILPAHYLRTLDVISEVNCVLLRSKRRFEMIALYPNFRRYIRTMLRFTNEEAGVQRVRLHLSQHAISELLTFYPK